MRHNRKKILILTLVHPDLLPPVYAIARTLRDEGATVHVLTFDSPVPSESKTETGITIESAGRHHGLGLMQRLAIRRQFTSRAAILAGESPDAIIACCAFSFLCGLKVKKQTPLVYHALEMSDFLWRSIKRSPLSMLNNLLALRSIHKADMVTTPSAQRAAWLAGRCKMETMPQVVLNTVYLSDTAASDTLSTYRDLVPAQLHGKKTILYMGSVNTQNCVLELVQAFCSVNNQDSALLIAGMKDTAYCNDIRNYVAQSAVADRIVLFPFVAGSTKTALQTHADIGVCLARETDDPESKMTAPNKVGEYLACGLYVLGSATVYMQLFELLEVASLAAMPDAKSIAGAMTDALVAVQDPQYKRRIDKFVNRYYCMQQQIEPISDFIAARKP
jgi:glycosyltransferase involved in cell wall biosynthesis